jgi:pyruvate formate-lyase activating enzyme-like uncharacterized protein
MYCPTEQREVGEAATNNLSFPRAEDYAAYLRRLGFTGSSMSGGEPLLTFDRTLRYLEATRAAIGSVGYLWMYTNGILLTAERAARLAETGLNEVRIDLSAADYDLGPVRLAAEHLGTVTVEIPALPEDAERLIALLPELVTAGVRHLNLHELRCTPHNLPRLARRGYVFRHGPRVTVVGSELGALGVLRAAFDANVPLPVNYCSAVYKALYQARAARARAAEVARAPGESVTEAGYLRELRYTEGAPTHVRYHLAALRSAPSYQAVFREIELDSGRSIVVERTQAGEASGLLPQYETLPEGLVPYF